MDSAAGGPVGRACKLFGCCRRAHTIRLIRLVFREQEFARTQEFVLRWLPMGQAPGTMSSGSSGTSVRRTQ